ncbi:uncharacterized protein PV09_00434 [Verruconis gallopava]|uniref:Uncharacterized protein n=1 Tax=Verruconis gallopava TaxID=253628 RepID=A0A0D1Y3R4_9PEZI|nr:uncharacterized protein PV09_00434 [Verruconis gallopava]KIW09561.1 hypothetical protein PV09_00434 [Verruconis gallopava]
MKDFRRIRMGAEALVRARALFHLREFLPDLAHGVDTCRVYSLIVKTLESICIGFFPSHPAATGLGLGACVDIVSAERSCRLCAEQGVGISLLRKVVSATHMQLKAMYRELGTARENNLERRTECCGDSCASRARRKVSHVRLHECRCPNTPCRRQERFILPASVERNEFEQKKFFQKRRNWTRSSLSIPGPRKGKSQKPYRG